MKRLSSDLVGRHCLAAAMLSVGVAAWMTPAQAQSWATCVEAIAKTQHELKLTSPAPTQPPTQDQSVAAQDSRQPTPSSLAAAGLQPPESGAAGALNEAQNLQAAGDNAGCMKAVAKARSLAGLK
jgi:hypothetical protein